jgi:hypothetical protein
MGEENTRAHQGHQRAQRRQHLWYSELSSPRPMSRKENCCCTVKEKTSHG